ncbi:MAG: hypothetical protein JNK85_18790 [Verrucomicrobiales bacterium]|nr:hypothetical protein [Verrucomicrobiales bacterium]
MKRLLVRTIFGGWVAIAWWLGGPHSGLAGTLDLNGRVMGAGGIPVVGAEVLVHTAGPRVGTSGLCPSCYPDCRKRVTTDATGAFEIEALDDSLLFRLLVVAKDHVPVFVAKVDPGAGAVEARLERVDWGSIPAERRIQGRLLGPEGEPVADATVSVEGVELSQGTRWGAVSEVDPLAVTDKAGAFALATKEPLKAVHALVEAPNLAKQWMRLVPGRVAMGRLRTGVRVSGRVIAGTTPVTNVIIGIAGASRRAGEWMGSFNAMTDAHGEFTVANLPANLEYFVYGMMDSFRDRGAVVTRKFRLGVDGSESNVGELKVVNAHRVAGRIRLSNGGKVPARTRLWFAREEAWDAIQVELDDQGRFEIKGVPPEAVSLGLHLQGYRMAQKNPNLDWLNGKIIGRVDRDILDLTIVLEPGNWKGGREDAPRGRNPYPRDMPLRGVKD